MSNGYGPRHENLYKDHEITIFSTQDVGQYLSCICRRFLLTRRLVWKLFEERKWYNSYVAIIRFYHSSWKISIKTHAKCNILRFYHKLYPANKVRKSNVILQLYFGNLGKLLFGDVDGT